MYSHLFFPSPFLFECFIVLFFPIVFYIFFFFIYIRSRVLLVLTIHQGTNNLLSMIILDPSVLQAQCIFNLKKKKERKERKGI